MIIKIEIMLLPSVIKDTMWREAVYLNKQQRCHKGTPRGHCNVEILPIEDGAFHIRNWSFMPQSHISYSNTFLRYIIVSGNNCS
jgi:hypothetical protein